MSVMAGLVGSIGRQLQYRAAELRKTDEKGWIPIHHAAFQGHVISLNRFVKLDLKAVISCINIVHNYFSYSISAFSY